MSRLALQNSREQRTETIKHLAGDRYSKFGTKKKTYLNLLALYFNIVPRNLIAKNPRCMLSTLSQDDRPTVKAMEQWTNEEIERLNMARVFQRVVYDALILAGVQKTCLATPADAMAAGWRIKAGDVISTWIDWDDFVFDVHCRDISEASFIGHRYRMSKAMAEANPRFNKKARNNLAESMHERWNTEGDEKATAIGRGDYGFMQSELEPMVDLWEIYFPYHKCVITLTDDLIVGASSDNSGKAVALEEKEYLGPEDGPYDILSYGLVPGNPIPKGPALDIIDLHLNANEIARKLVRQASRQKELLIGQNSEDMEAINKQPDGHSVRVDQPDKAKVAAFGGPNQGLLLFLNWTLDQFDKMAGNLSTLGGLRSQANTLGQEELLASQAGGQIASMQDVTFAHVTSVIRKMGWHWWHDPSSVRKVNYQLPSSNRMFPREIHPWNAPDMPMNGRMVSPLRRDGDMPTFKVDAYSIRHTTPQQRMQDLMGFLSTVYAPMAQIAMSQGEVLSFRKLLEIYSKLRDAPEVTELFSTTFMPEQTMAGEGGEHMATKSPNTTREVVRRSAGGESANNRDGMLQNILSAGGEMNGKARNLT